MNVMNNGQMDPALKNEENHEKNPVRLIGTAIRTRNLPNASPVRYHGATSLDKFLGHILQLDQIYLIRLVPYRLILKAFYSINEFLNLSNIEL